VRRFGVGNPRAHGPRVSTSLTGTDDELGGGVPMAVDSDHEGLTRSSNRSPSQLETSHTHTHTHACSKCARVELTTYRVHTYFYKNGPIDKGG
jgi:hypothetical protein